MYAGWEANTLSAVVLPIISSIFSFTFSIGTAITASSCPIDVENVKKILNERHSLLKEITSLNCHSKAFKEIVFVSKK